MSFDPDRQIISLRVSYLAAAIALAAVAVLIATAYLAGGRLGSRQPLLLSTATAQQAMQQAPRPEVLNVSARRVETPAPEEPLPPATEARSAVASWNEPQAPSTHVVVDRNRQVGLNYIVVQSYVDEKTAREACDLLEANGVSCTVEKGLPGFGSRWFSVLGTRGFARISDSPEYRADLAKVRRLSDQFAPRKGFKAFEPMAYQWKGR